MLMGLSLGVLVSLAFLNVVVFGGDWKGSDVSFLGEQLTFSIDPLEGAIGMLMIVLLLSALVGINIMGSGLSDSSVKLIGLGIAYLGLWGTFSALSFNLFLKIPLNLGIAIYIILTIMFVISVFTKYTGGGGGSND